MQTIKCPNCGSGEVRQLINEKYQCIGCENEFLIHNLSKEFKKTDEHITELHRDLKETIEKTINKNGVSTEDALIKRALLYIEDGHYIKADEVLEQALNINPENAEIYAIKLLADLSVKNVKGLSSCVNKVVENSNFEKLIRFSNDFEQPVVEEIKNVVYETVFSQYSSQDNNKENIQYFLNVFQKLENYKDSSKIYHVLFKRLTDLEKEEIEKKNEKDYCFASSQMSNRLMTIENMEHVIDIFKNLGDYKDSQVKLKQCEEILKKKKSARTKIMAMVIGIVILGSIIGIFINSVIIPSINYSKAKEAEEKGMLYEAMIFYEAAGAYKNSEEKKNELYQLFENKYYQAKEEYYSGNIVDAYNILCTIGSYQDSKAVLEQLTDHLESTYTEAIKEFNAKNGKRASSLFASIIGYKDSEEYYDKCFDCNYIGHDWNTRVCGSPCTVCGEKKDTNVNCIPGIEPTCYDGQYCMVCNTLLREALGHDYSEATCTEPPICTVCGMEGGYALGHKWGEETCLEPTFCTVCGEVVQEVQGHSFGGDGICRVCGVEYNCEYDIDLSSTEYIALYDSYYEGEQEHGGQGYVVLKDTLDGTGAVVFWAKYYVFEKEDPVVIETILFFAENKEELPQDFLPFPDLKEENPKKVIYGITFGW